MPIDIASGTAKLDFEDVSSPGHVPLVWDRNYSTRLLDRPPGALGQGWTGRWFSTLTYRDGQFEFLAPDGSTERIANLDQGFARGKPLVQLGAFLEVFREGQTAVVRTWDVETGAVWRYVFAAGLAGQPWPLASLEDVSAQQAVDLRWDNSGRLLQAQQRLEQRALLPVYDSQGRITRVDLRAQDGSLHPVVTYGHDAAGRLIEARDAAGFADRFEYDAAGRITREVVKDGGVFHYRYDVQGRCVLRTGLAHYNEKRLRYIDSIRTTEVSNSCGEKTLYEHLPTGQAVSVTDPLGARQTTDYDAQGRIVAETDATGATTRYTYDTQGNRDSIADALGQVTRFTFNDSHQALSMTDAAGNVWLRAYDAQQRLVASMDPLDGRWRFVYDDDGNVAEVINPKGHRKHQVFANGVLTSATDWMAHATRYSFDPFGRVTERTGPLGERTTFRYDLMGNPVAVQLPDSTELKATYDHAGNLTRFIDANGHITRWRYGPCARLLARTDPVGGTVHYVWGSERGRLEAVVNEKGERYSFERDEAGRIVREISFDGAVRQFRLDAEGHSIGYTNANEETIAIERDPLHRVVGQRLPDGEQVRYAFDPIGGLVAAINADIAVTIERDALGRITRENQGDEWVSSRYDAVGNLIETRTSQGHEARYEHDANGRMSALITAGGKRIDFERDANGQETVRHMPGGTRMTQRFDKMGRLVEQRVAGASGAFGASADLVRRDYRYDRNGALTRIVDGCWGQVDYTYDPAERLLSAIRQRGAAGDGGPSEQFEYDPACNLTRMRSEGTRNADDELVYGPGNRLLRKGSTWYEYDAEGRRVRKIEDADGDAPRVWTFEWTALGRLRKFTPPDGISWSYRYDALARRVAKVQSKEVGSNQCGTGIASSDQSHSNEFFLWDQDVMVQQRRGDEINSTWVFEHYGFVPLARLSRQGLQVVVNDQLGTPRELLGEDGSIVSIATNSVWGGNSEKGSCPLGFQGQWHDEETKLEYNFNRYFDSDTGQYISRDPIGLYGNNNFYRFCRNPVNWIDPYGLIGTDCTNNGKGYVVYHILSEPDGKVLYVGITQADRFQARQDEHGESGRLSGTREMTIARTVGTYGEARGHEQAHIEHFDTRNTKLIGDHDYVNDPANRINSYDTSRVDERADAFNSGRASALAEL